MDSKKSHWFNGGLFLVFIFSISSINALPTKTLTETTPENMDDATKDAKKVICEFGSIEKYRYLEQSTMIKTDELKKTHESVVGLKKVKNAECNLYDGNIFESKDHIYTPNYKITSVGKNWLDILLKDSKVQVTMTLVMCQIKLPTTDQYIQPPGKHLMPCSSAFLDMNQKEMQHFAYPFCYHTNMGDLDTIGMCIIDSQKQWQCYFIQEISTGRADNKIKPLVSNVDNSQNICKNLGAILTMDPVKVQGHFANKLGQHQDMIETQGNGLPKYDWDSNAKLFPLPPMTPKDGRGQAEVLINPQPEEQKDDMKMSDMALQFATTTSIPMVIFLMAVGHKINPRTLWLFLASIFMAHIAAHESHMPRVQVLIKETRQWQTECQSKSNSCETFVACAKAFEKNCSESYKPGDYEYRLLEYPICFYFNVKEFNVKRHGRIECHEKYIEVDYKGKCNNDATKTNCKAFIECCNSIDGGTCLLYEFAELEKTVCKDLRNPFNIDDATCRCATNGSQELRMLPSSPTPYHPVLPTTATDTSGSIQYGGSGFTIAVISVTTSAVVWIMATHD